MSLLLYLNQINNNLCKISDNDDIIEYYLFLTTEYLKYNEITPQFETYLTSRYSELIKYLGKQCLCRTTLNLIKAICDLGEGIFTQMITKGIISDLVFYYLEYRKLSNSLSQYDRFYLLILCCALLNNFDGTDSEHYKTQFVTEIRDHKVYDDISSALQNTKSIMPNEIIFIIDLINELFTIDHSNGPVEFYELNQ